jgi:hypothetical protein
MRIRPATLARIVRDAAQRAPADELARCPRCGRAKTGFVYGRAVCLACRSHPRAYHAAAEAIAANRRATLRRIADGAPIVAEVAPRRERPIAPPHVVVLTHDPPPPLPVPVEDDEPTPPVEAGTLRDRLRARRAQEATSHG